MAGSQGLGRRGRIGVIVAVIVAVAGIGLAVLWPRGDGAASSTSPSVTASSGATTGEGTPEAAGTQAPEPSETAPQDPGEATPVPFAEPVTTASKLVVTVDSVTAVTAGEALPGEVTGPAVQVTLTVRNDGASTAAVRGASLNLTYGGDERTPAAPVSSDGTIAWPDTLEPGASATVVSTFSVPETNAGEVRVIVDLLASEPDVVFVGSRPE